MKKNRRILSIILIFINKILSAYNNRKDFIYELDITCKDGNTGKMICVTQASFIETTNDGELPRT